MPEISVIIPAYKARNYLAGALNSVADQTFRDWEILLVDDYSPDPIDDIVSEFKSRTGCDVRLLRHNENQGLGGARNTGIRESLGAWVALLDHDDIWASDHLESLHNACTTQSVDLAFCSVQEFSKQPGDLKSVWGPKENIPKDAFPLALFEYSFITPSATLIRKSLLMQVGGFNTDPKVHMVEDLDLWLRLMQAGAHIVHVKKPTCYYRKHVQAATSRPGYMVFQSAWVRQVHASKVRGSWFRKRSIVAYRWWAAWIAFLDLGERRWDVLRRALISSILVPHELVRGIVRTFRKIFGKAWLPHCRRPN